MVDDSFVNFLSEIRAEKKSQTFDQMTERLIAERDLRKYFDELKNKKYIVQENVDLSIDFDFLIRKESSEVIGILEPKGTHFKITFDKLKKLNLLLSENPQSRAIMLTWIIRPNYPSVLMYPDFLNKKIRSSKPDCDLTSLVRPIRDAVGSFFKELPSLISTEVQVPEKELKQAEKLRFYEVLNEFLMQEYNKVKEKNFRLDYKIKAVDELSVDDVNKIGQIFKEVFDEKFDQSSLERFLRQTSKVKQR